MNKATHHPFSFTVRLLLIALLAITLTVSTGQTAQASGQTMPQTYIVYPNPAPVNLGMAAPFATLSKAATTITGVAHITGNVGVSPIAASAMTGFGLIADSTNTFSTSSLVTGKIYASDYAPPTPINMGTTIGNMETAYTTTAGLASDVSGEGAGNLSGLTLGRGVHTWGTSVSIDPAATLTLDGSATDIFIFQIAGNLTLNSGAQILLTGGAKASNVFWQVAGGVGVNINTTAHFEGTILAVAGINLLTNATMNGRLLSQTAIALDANTVVLPTPFVLDSLCTSTSATSMDFTVNFPQSVTGVDASDFTLTTTGVVGASIGVVTGSGTSWTVPVNTGTGNGTIRLDMNTSGTGIVDAVTGDPVSGGFISGNICNIEKSALNVVSIVRVSPETTNLTTVDFTVTFSEAVTGVDIADFKLMNTLLTGASVTNVVPVSTSVYTVTVNTGTGNGTIRLDVPPLTATIENILGAIVNPFTGGETYIVAKGAAPTVPVLVSPLNGALVIGYLPTLEWNDSSPVMALANPWSYEINVTDGVFATYDQTFNTASGLSNSSYTFTTPLAANTTFYWKVRAYNDQNQYSAWSLTRSFRTSLATPMLNLPADSTTLTTKRPTFTWGAVSGATSYTLCVMKGTVIVLMITTTATTYTPVADLLGSQLYTWKVKANGLNAGVYSAPFTFTTSLNPPTVPVQTAPINGALLPNGATQTLDWNPVLAKLTVPTAPAAVSYDVEYATNSAFVNSTTTNVVAPTTALSIASSANTTYYWRVRSVNATGQFSAWSVTRYFRTMLATPVLNTPANGTTENNKRPTFSWDAVPGATSYYLQVFKGSALVINVTVRAPAYTYTHTADLLANTQYTWKVRANGVNTGVFSAPFTFNTSVTNPPAIPVQTAPINGVFVGAVAQTLDWNVITTLPAPLGYEVEYATNSAFTGSTVTFVAGNTVGTTLLNVGVLSPGRTYYWRVRSWSTANTSGNHSAWSLVRMINVKFVAPTLVSPLNSATGVSRSAPVFVWDSGANGLWTTYTLQISTSNLFSRGTINYTIAAPLQTFTMPAAVTDLLPLRPYFWRVRINGLYFPIFSASQSFTTGN